MPRGGPSTVITTLGVLRFEPDTKEMILTSVHPGVSVNTVLENTAWQLKISEDLMTTPAPADAELDILARFDPHGYWTGE